MPIRLLDPSEVALVADFYRAAPDYWLLAEGTCDPDRQAAEFFTDGPPACDRSLTHHLGLFLPAAETGDPRAGTGASHSPCADGRGVEGRPILPASPDGMRLSGVAELSYGFPEATDAYLGLMLLGPWARGAGHGRAMLDQAETLARARGARRIVLAVLEANPRGRAFWEREGFRATGLSRRDQVTGHTLHRLVKAL
ncbi:N-acetyltransferase [Tabrizicola sp. YIM 78059]|uniref:GNAT family N-acetyltransferase n=1 Tax=Tabrizicola sp. YIM 78059 TaxID=2529861 RepID=UPI0020C157C1|nr:GNAT family N-acetyltransferase [Tabrizicola sp. YIM 78059]